MTLPAPGVHLGVPRAAYEAWPATNHSTLRLFDRTAAHARHAMSRGGLNPTPALEFGTRVHLAALEPERWSLEYSAIPVGTERRTAAGKRAWAAFVASSNGRVLVEADDYARVEACARALRSSSTAAALLDAPGANEVSLLWLDRETKAPCKARLDRLTALHGWTFVLDVKTGRDASPRTFGSDVADYGYHEQAAFYLDGLETLSPASRRWAWVVVEKNPPHCVAVYEPTDESIREGRKAYRGHLAELLECQRTGVWPGYPDGIEPLQLPRWARSRSSSEEE